MLTIYFNRTYSTNTHVIAMLRANPDGRAVRVIATHADPSSPVLAASDVTAPEPPEDVRGEDYVRWALEFTAAHDVDVFVPRLEMDALAGARERFAAQGVRLLSAPAAAVRHFEDKHATYVDAAARGLPVPPYRVVADGASLRAAFAEIDALCGSACLKPVSGVGGDGFRILSADRPALVDLLGPLTPTVTVDAAADVLDRALAAGETVPPLLVLPFLPGPEVSVDVLARRDGRPVAAIGRSKDGRRRRIVDDPAAREIAETLVAAHGVSYLSNVQIRYWDGPSGRESLPFLLEVNTRMSGGLFQTALSGVNLPWAAVRLALGEEPEVPHARYDIGYTTVSALAVSR